MKQYPANPMQAAAFNRYQAAPTAPGANTQVSISFGESVNPDFLRHAWRVVMQRHPILRCAFTKTIDGVMVREAEKAEPTWVPLDWQSVPQEEIPAKWNALLASDATSEFEPVAIPLLRLHEIRLPGGGGHHLLTTPAFLLDEFSLTRVLLDLLLTLGQSPMAPAGALPEPLKPKGWNEFLKGATAPMALEPRFGDGSFTRASVLLHREKTAVFAKFCLDHDLEESLVIRCLWSLLLRRFGASGNVMLSLFDGRGDSTEAGFFQSRVPVVHSWNGSVRDWLANAQTLTDTMSENIWIDPDEILKAAGLDFFPGDIAVSFVWNGSSINDNIHTALPRWINFDAQLQHVTPRGLVLEARPGTRLELSLSGPFSSDATAKEILARLAALVTGLPEFHSKPVTRVPVLLPPEIRTLREWSRGPEIAQQPSSVVEAFRKVVEKHGDSVAVKFGDYGMTYTELDTHSDKLAAHLAHAGFAGGWHTGLFLSPSAWISVALLGSWKAGNSCLAIDPTAPSQWVESTLAAHDVAVVICDGSSAPQIDPAQRRRIIIDQDWESLETAPAGLKTIQSDQLAASIPGHVDGPPPILRALTHGMLLSASLEGARILNFQAGDSFLVRSMPGGGAFFDEWLIPILSGGIAHVAGDDLLDSATAPVTHLRLTTPEWANQAASWERGGPAVSDTVRCVAIEGGNPLATSFKAWSRQLRPPIRQVVFFSPAGLCGLGLAGDAADDVAQLPVGKPTAEVEVLIADEDGLEIPAGYVGELFLKFPGWRTLPDSTGRSGFDLGLHAWRDGLGDVYLESASKSAPGIPTAAQRLAAQPLLGQAFDVHTGKAVYALSDHPVPGAVSVKEWLLTRAGWIDESALPQTQAAATTPQARTESAAESPRPAKPSSTPVSYTPLSQLAAGGAGELLVLVHPASGSPDIYTELVEALGSSRRVIGLTARGAHNPDACHPSIESAAAQYIATLLEDERPGDFQLAGFGFGGIVALEMARQLQAAGRDLPRLVLIGALPPHAEPPTGWLASVKNAFKRPPAGGRMEPFPSGNPTSARHEEAWKNYRFPVSDIPATIVLPSDLANESAAAWQAILPMAAIEITRSPWSEMLTMPAAKRIASILNTSSSTETLDLF